MKGLDYNLEKKELFEPSFNSIKQYQTKIEELEAKIVSLQKMVLVLFNEYNNNQKKLNYLAEDIGYCD